MTKREKRDIHQEVTDSIVAAIESGSASGDEWTMPWVKLASLGMPANATTGKHYRGINPIRLWVAAEDHGYSSPMWASFKQWQRIGAQVRAGEKGTPIVFYKSLTVQDREQPDSPDATKTIPMLRHSNVFNADQVDGYEPEPVEVPNVAERMDKAEEVISGTGAEFRTNGGRAYFNRADDYIGMPARELFKSTNGYYSTAFHELAHWTGTPARLDRKFGERFGDDAYAAEELVAELTSCFVMAELELEPAPRDDHAEYVANWLQLLKSDKKAIFTAAAKAGDAAAYIQENGQTKESEKS